MNTIDTAIPEQIKDPEAGMATAEYAVGTVAATSLGGILVWIFEQEWFRDLVSGIFRDIFSMF